MTLKRIRAYATVMAVALWSVLAIDFSVPGAIDRFGKAKGTDFLQFYVAGSFVREGQASLLYDLRAQHERGRVVAPTAEDTVYVPIQSPQVAFVFAPLAALSYSSALAVWILILVVLYAASCRLLWPAAGALHAYRREVIACCAAFPGFYSTVVHGQLSAVSLLAVCAAVAALGSGRAFLAGLALGCLVFKPHWALAAAAAFAFARDWRVVAGIAISAAAQLGATYLIAGPDVTGAYAHMLRSISAIGDLLEPRPGYSLKSLFDVFVPWPPLGSALYAAAAVTTLIAAARVWRSDARFEYRASAIVLAMLMISPHVFEYDLLLLAPVFFLLASVMASQVDTRRQQEAAWALAVLFVVPLLTPVYAPIRVPLSAGAMSVLLYVLWRRSSPSRGVALAATG